ncbi:MAG: hypothetical protein ACEPOW_05485 [Bacteroidales bacterium]
MKKYLFLFSLIICAGLLTSCNKDDDNNIIANQGPVLEFISGNNFITGNTEVELGAKVAFKFHLASSETTDKKLASFEINVVNDGVILKDISEIITDENKDEKVKNEKQVTIIREYTIDKEGKTTFNFTLTDKDGKANAKIVNVTVKKDVVPTPGSDVKTVKNIVLGSNSNSAGSFFSASELKGYAIAAAKSNAANIDFCFFNGASNGFTFASIDSELAPKMFTDKTNGIAAWNKRNATRFAKANITEKDFDAISDKYVFPTDFKCIEKEVTKAGNAPVFYFFVTEAGKKGIIKVTSLKDRLAGTATIDVVVEK